MASRTPLLTIQYYDRDGGLDWAIHGSQWSEWYTDQLTRKSKNEIRTEIELKFKSLLDAALDCDLTPVGKKYHG